PVSASSEPIEVVISVMARRPRYRPPARDVPGTPLTRRVADGTAALPPRQRPATGREAVSPAGGGLSRTDGLSAITQADGPRRRLAASAVGGCPRRRTTRMTNPIN